MLSKLENKHCIIRHILYSTRLTPREFTLYVVKHLCQIENCLLFITCREYNSKIWNLCSFFLLRIARFPQLHMIYALIFIAYACLCNDYCIFDLPNIIAIFTESANKQTWFRTPTKHSRLVSVLNLFAYNLDLPLLLWLGCSSLNQYD